MDANVNVSVFEFDRRPVWPHFEIAQLLDSPAAG
jgi:hypothetical protein